MEVEAFRTPEERLGDIADRLLASIIGSDEASKSKRRNLFGSLVPEVFRDENYILYNTFYFFKDRGITPDEDFVQMYLSRNTKQIKDSQGYINLTEFQDLDENPYLAYIAAVLKKYSRLRSLEVLSEDDFLLEIEKYKTEYSSYEMNKAYSQSKMILYDGIQVGNKFYQGYEDSVAYVKKSMASVESVLNRTSGVGFVDSRTMAVEDKEQSEAIKVSDFDLIDELNEKLGGVYTSLFYSVLAPTKGGKSKFCARIIHTAMVRYGVNVSVWAHEGGYEAWWAQLRAIHFEYMYIRGKSESERVAPLSQQDILHKRYPSDEIRILENESRLDLFTNPAYGVANMIDRPFYTETFIDELSTSVSLNDSKIVLVDYLQLIGTNERGKSKNQAIGEAYQKALSFCNKRNVAFISPAQFTQAFMDEVAKSKSGDTHEVRTSGGESAEVVRTPDINIVLYATVEDLIRQEMTIMSAPSRMMGAFPDIPIYADLCSSVFSSIEES